MDLILYFITVEKIESGGNTVFKTTPKRDYYTHRINNYHQTWEFAAFEQTSNTKIVHVSCVMLNTFIFLKSVGIRVFYKSGLNFVKDTFQAPSLKKRLFYSVYGEVFLQMTKR